MNQSGRRNLCVILIVALGVAGCNTVAVEEARKVEAAFDGQSFTPPPRTVEDITAILDLQGVSNPAIFKAKLDLAAREPSPDILNDADELAQFYYKRTRAAFDVGRMAQAYDDIRRASALVDSGDVQSPRLRAIIVSVHGTAARAMGKWQEAEERFEQGIKLKSPSSYSNIVRVHISRGDFEAAEAAAEKGIRWSKKWVKRRKISPSGRFATAMNVPMISGFMEASTGNWAEAETHFREALALLDEQEAKTGMRPVSRIIAAGNGLRTSLVRQNRLVEAEIFARDTLLSFLERRGKLNHVTALLAGQLAQVVDAQGRHEEARVLVMAALDIFGAVGVPVDTPLLGATRYRLGEILVSLEQWPEAAGLFDKLQHDFATHRAATFDRWSRNSIDVPFAYLMSKRIDVAARMTTADYAAARQRLGDDHPVTALKGTMLAMVMAEQGRQAEALDHYQRSLPALLESSERTPASEKRLRFMMEAYIELLLDIRGSDLERKANIDAVHEAFRVSDMARSRSVETAMAASGVRAAAGNDELATLIRLEQDLDNRLKAVLQALANAAALPTAEQDSDAIAGLRERVKKVQTDQRKLQIDIAGRFPEYADLVRPERTTVERARKALRSNEAVISTYVAGDRTYVWAIPRSGPIGFTSAPVGRQWIRDKVAQLRRALDPEAETLGDIPPFDVATAHELYKHILAPLEPDWGSADSLLVIAHDALSQLPFTALVTRPSGGPTGGAPLFSGYKSIPWLARTHAVTALPSVTSLVSLRRLPPARAARRQFAGFGDPYFSRQQAAQAGVAPGQIVNSEKKTAKQQVAFYQPDELALRSPVRRRSSPRTRGVRSADLGTLPRLPDTGDEVRSIAKVMKADLKRDLFIGVRATEDTVKSENLANYRVVAFATHGLIPGDLDGLHEPALALSSPTVAGGTGDGLLTMGEILGLRLDADWVVLSACNTAAAEGAGAEAYSGLGRAFFYAGTRALLLSNWPVETTSAQALTTDIFRRQADQPQLARAKALQQAMLGLVDGPGYIDAASGKIVFSYAHPIFWAPFTLLGDGGSSGPSS
jgi:CHAT domain-containing protein